MRVVRKRPGLGGSPGSAGGQNEGHHDEQIDQRDKHEETHRGHLAEPERRRLRGAAPAARSAPLATGSTATSDMDSPPLATGH